jgi:uncharacterized protein with HEPN domain
MQANDAIRLRHMLEAAEKAVEFSARKTRADLDDDQILVLALIKCVEIIGEAANKVSDECRKELTAIPWADIVGMRHRLIHGYFDINLDIVWRTVEQELPELISELKKAQLSTEPG